MKLMKLHDNKMSVLKKKFIVKIGDELVRMTADPRGCLVGFLYEPELTPEIILESLNVNIIKRY